MSTKENKNENLTLVGNENAVEEENTTDSGIVTVKLRRPLDYEGKIYEELSFDFDRLTGEDDRKIEQELGRSVMVPALTTDYLIRMCARACTAEIGFDAFNYMSLRDYDKIRTAARNFLVK